MKARDHRYSLFLLFFCFLLLRTEAQNPIFYHLTTADGLSDNNVKSVSIDKNRFLWIGTVDGLNLYDGYSVTTFKKENNPEMASNNIIHMTCDKKNRIWLGSPEGITWIDENRNFHRVILEDTVSKFGCRTVMDTKALGPILYTSLGQYFFDEGKQKWQKIDWIPATLRYNRFSDAEPFDENRIIYATDSLIMIVDYANKRISYQQPFKSVFSLCRYSDHELAVGIQFGDVQIVDINTHEIVKSYHITSELNKKQINSTLTEVRPAVNGSLMVATEYAGLVMIDKQGNISGYTHDPINPSSIGANLTWRVLSSTNGDVIVGTTNAGVSIFNIYNKQADNLRLFNDGKGNFYDSYVCKMVQDKAGKIWIGALERLICWDKENHDKIKFYYYLSKPILTGAQNIEIRSVCIDNQGRKWISALGDGIALLNETTGQFKKIDRDTSLSRALKSDYVNDIYAASDGFIWAGSGGGAYKINPSTFKCISFKDDPVLGKLEGKRVNAFLEDRKNNMWIATSYGLFRYMRKENRLDSIRGLGSTVCTFLYEDKQGRVYAGTAKGFSIISDGDKIRNYDRTNGLKMDQCQGILQDNSGRMWVANTKYIISFNPDKNDMQYFDDNSGLTTEGFRTGSFLKTNRGELFWGGRSGLNYFFPEKITNYPVDLRVNIYEAETPDSILYLGNRNKLELEYRDNSIVFRFNAINLKGSRNIHYQYKLENYDAGWLSGVDVRQARYSSLPAGHYTFKVKASTDGVNWISAGKDIEATIIPPVWQRWWFIGAILALVVAGIYLYISNRNKKIAQQQEEIEREQAISYFASSMSEQQTEENILWDVVKNCIARLQFEDCVIYLLDEEKGMLVQKAAHGPKSPREFEIDQPMGIELGKGIVGSVAFSGKPEIIKDTTRDPRYIVDVEQRMSEISVPIISDGRVLGVIDCEHSKKGFFTQKHLSILTTIASLCANKIIRARAEEEKRKAQAILMNTQQKMTEVEMQALRAQMNPHFIFNCLNSINRYIVKSDQATASLYLTKFAKLIRLILDNSNSKNVILANELEALKLYIEMEALRFDKKFSYEIKMADHMSADSVEVPPLIIQPYVENAIWHGLLHKETSGHLSIRVSMASDTMLECIIEDNGIGRLKAKELKSKTATSRKSLGMQLTENRLSLLNKHAQLNASIEIIDLEGTAREALGTKVILKIPV